MANIKNISLKDFRKWLISKGCEKIRTNGGHEIWSKKGLARPLTFQTHIDPVPMLIVKQIIRYLDTSVEDFLSQMDKI